MTGSVISAEAWSSILKCSGYEKHVSEAFSAAYVRRSQSRSIMASDCFVDS